MTPEEQAAVEQVRTNYKSISDNFFRLLEACGEDRPLKRQVGDAMEEALRNYIETQNRILGKSAATIKKINKAATDAQTEIKKALEDLQQVKKTLNAITKAVKTVGILVAAL
jgi:uncharacterized phage infection (PIP) family protein YhgE